VIYAAAGEQDASLEVVRFQVGHLGQNLRSIKTGREQVQNVADTNAHPSHARPSAALPGIDGDPFQHVLHILALQCTRQTAKSKPNWHLPAEGRRTKFFGAGISSSLPWFASVSL
jgi:hypothetical protein